MKAKARATAQRLLNLYRQEHVIIGGWLAINPIFVKEADDIVMEELNQLPTGKQLVQHIENLRSGKTTMDRIEPELLPYGGMMGNSATSVSLTDNEMNELRNAIEFFTPDQAGLNTFVSQSFIKRFGNEWPIAVRAALVDYPDLMAKFETIDQTYNAYRYWGMATDIVANPISERVRAQVQADMPEYETYLPMFGDAGNDLLIKLRTFISSLN